MLNTLNENEIKNLKIISINKGEILFKENDTCKFVGIVIDGKLKISSFMSNGKELIYNIINQDDIFGSNLIFSSDRRYKGDIAAITNSKILLIDKENLLRILKENTNFLITYLSKQANQSKNQSLKLKLLSFENAQDRLLYFLSINNNSIKINTITKLANDLHLSREATSRCVSSLIKKKILIKENGYLKTVK